MVVLFTLNEKGILSALVVGVLIFFLGQSYGLFFVADAGAFLVLSAIVTSAGKVKKVGIGMYEHTRGWKNVLSNGLIPLVISALYFFNSYNQVLPPAYVAVVYVASIAAITADKFASEIGVLDGEPRMLVTMKRVKKGCSGGVTALGTFSSLFSAFVIGLSALFLGWSLGVVAILTVSGFLGGIVDSILGYWEEKGIGNKYTSNFFCAVAGSIICALLLSYFHVGI